MIWIYRGYRCFRAWNYSNDGFLFSISNLNLLTTSSEFPRCLSRWHQIFSFPDSNNGPPVVSLHAKALKEGSFQNLGNFLLGVYVRYKNLDAAQKLFDEILFRDTQTWTILISGFARIGSSEMVLSLFREMQVAGACPNHYTLSSFIKCCSTVSNLRLGKVVHGWILRNKIEGDIVLYNSILDLYLKCRVVEYAKRLFQLMQGTDLVSWNIMIRAYLHAGDVERSLDMFRSLNYKDVVSWNTIIDGLMQCGYERAALEQLYFMVDSGTEFSAFTISIALTLAASLSLTELGRQLHGRVLRFDINNDGFIRSSLVEMYCKCERVEKACLIFRELRLDFLRTQDSGLTSKEQLAGIVSWSSMVSGYIQNGKYEDGLRSFKFMVCELIAVDILTVTSVISACADAGMLEFGRQMHAYIQKIGHRIDAYVGSALIDMYSKSGSLSDAWMIFRQINYGNVVMWTSMISGCAFHGQGREAICLFEEMINMRIIPNEVTFLGVLNACSHLGLIEEGHRYFGMMKDGYCIDPGVEHFTSMVALYGRAGRLNEAKEFIFKNGISQLSTVWKSFLSSCRFHKDFEMGKWVSETLLQVAPSDAGAYILSSNICAANHRWDETARVRSLMHGRGLKKQPGQSWIQLKDQIHSFVMGDRSHAQHKDIYSNLDSLIARLKEIGYSPDVELVIQDIEEEQAEVLVGHHSEKLALVFGIMNTTRWMPIRIMKNLRICIDCHNFVKYTSRLLEREIIVRDIHRFHHFKHGSCSCGDYW